MSKARKAAMQHYDDMMDDPADWWEILPDAEKYGLPPCISWVDLNHAAKVIRKYGRTAFESEFPRNDLGFSFEIISPLALWNLMVLAEVPNNLRKMCGLPMHRKGVRR